jgi:hypothetical protein
VPNLIFKTLSASFAALLVGCAATSFTFDDAAGVYGGNTAGFGGSTLLLRADGTYSQCAWTDTPEFDGQFSREISGPYALDGQRIEYVDVISDRPVQRYLVRVGRKIYMVTEDTFLDYGNDRDVVEDIGLSRMSAADAPYACLGQ